MMLTVKNVFKTYYGPKQKREALRGISFELPETGLVFIAGESGCGKSALISLIGGTDRPTKGDIYLYDLHINRCGDDVLTEYRNASTAFISDLGEKMCGEVKRSISFPLDLQGKRYSTDDIVRAMQGAGLERELLNGKAEKLSTAKRRRVFVARALIKNARIVLADEPAEGLGEDEAEELYKLLKNLSKNRLIVVAARNVQSAMRFGDRVIQLAGGKIKSDTYIAPPPPERAGAPRPPLTLPGKLPAACVFTEAVKGLRICPVFAAVCTAIMVIALAALSLAFAGGTANQYKAELLMLYESDVKSVGIEAYNPIYQLNYYPMGFSPLSDEQLETIKQFNGGDPPLRVISGTAVLGNWAEENLAMPDGERSAYDRLCTAYTCIELDPETGCEDAGLAPDARFLNVSLCRLPQTEDEVAITDLRADIFIKYGYKNADGTVEKISTPDDLIGKKLGKAAICGVYSTRFDREYYAKFDDVTYAELRESNPYASNIISGTARSTACAIFFKSVPRAYYSDDEVFITLSGDFKKDLQLFNDLNFREGNLQKSVSMNSVYSSFISPLMFFKRHILAPLCIGGGVCAAVAAALGAIWLACVFKRRRDEFYALRANGARQRDIAKICVAQCAAVALIAFAAALAALSAACLILNAALLAPLFAISAGIIAFTAGATLVITAAASAGRIICAVKKNRLDDINNSAI